MKRDSNFPYHYHIVAVFIITISCVLIYANTLYFPFLFDDLDSILENPHIRLTSLNIQKICDAGTKSPRANRPVANISFALNYYFGQYNPTGYHAINIMVHLINGILVYFLSLYLFSSSHRSTPKPFSPTPAFPVFLMSLFSSLFFIAHPLQTQSVTYIVQRMTSLSAMFFLLSLFLYIHARSSKAVWKRWTLFISCLLSWFMALGSKQIAITLPFIVFLYEWGFIQDFNTSWLKGNIKYLLVSFVLLCLLAFIYLKGEPIGRILAGYVHRPFTLGQRVLTEFRVLIFYISLILYPHPSRLNLHHHFTISQSLFEPMTTALSLVVILGLIGLSWYFARKNRLISFGILWFFINLALESSVIGLELLYEHRLYLPMLGPAIIISWLVFSLLSKKRIWAIVICSAIILTLAIAANVRNRVWRDAVSLWTDIVSKNPRAYRAHNNLGLALSERGRIDEAIRAYQEALRLCPESFKTYYNLGTALEMQGKVDEAIQCYSIVLTMAPGFAGPYYNLGRIYLQQGRMDEAVEHLKASLKRDPEHAMTIWYLGICSASQRRYDEAVRYFNKALRIDPHFAEAHYNLGTALLMQKDIGQAIKHFSEALKINPEFREAKEMLERALKIRSRQK